MAAREAGVGRPAAGNWDWAFPHVTRRPVPASWIGRTSRQVGTLSLCLAAGHLPIRDAVALRTVSWHGYFANWVAPRANLPIRALAVRPVLRRGHRRREAGMAAREAGIGRPAADNWDWALPHVTRRPVPASWIGRTSRQAGALSLCLAAGHLPIRDAVALRTESCLLYTSPSPRD